MNNNFFIILLFAVAITATLLISGCSQPQTGDTETITTTTMNSITEQTTTTAIAGNEITIMSAPSSATTGSNFVISWLIQGNRDNAVKTTIYYGKQSVPNPISVYSYDNNSKLQCIGDPCVVPGPFTDEFSISESGTYYYRAYAKINGIDVWSEERVIEISNPFSYKISNFTIEVDENGFYKDGSPLSFIEVNRNDVINITFRVSSENSYAPGYTFMGCNSGVSVLPGNEGGFFFSTNSNCAISMYKASSGVLEYSLSVRSI